MKIPGFLDLQVNGYKGVDFSSLELLEPDIISAAQNLIHEGTAAFLPTVITSSLHVYRRNLRLIAGIMDLPELRGRVPGIHLEGPFLSPHTGARGVHNPEWIRKPDISLFDRLQGYARGQIRLITIAADAEGAEELTRHAVSTGVTVSLGHHMAGEEDLNRLAAAGATALTHLGNGVPHTLHRHKNPIWAGLAEHSLTAMVVTDGHHLPGSMIKIFLKTKGLSSIVVTSDASPLAGLPPGRYRSMGAEVVLEDSGLLHDPEKQCLAGSSSTMLGCMNVLSSLGVLSFEELMQVGFYNPMRLIGLPQDSIPQDILIEYDEGERLFFKKTSL
jgi:N-acetylglucosamine-6-phosphate deacetylase